MDDAVNFGVLVKDGIETLFVANVDVVECRATARELLDAVDDVLKGVVQVIDNHDIVAAVEKGESGERTNVAGSAGRWLACPHRFNDRRRG